VIAAALLCYAVAIIAGSVAEAKTRGELASAQRTTSLV